VLLEPCPEDLQRRLEARAAQGGHFMAPQLLASQLAALQYEERELFLHVASFGAGGRADNCCSGGAGPQAASATDSGAAEGRASSGSGGAPPLSKVSGMAGSFPGPAEVVQMVLAKLGSC
jgi:hypothetical protein